MTPVAVAITSCMDLFWICVGLRRCKVWFHNIAFVSACAPHASCHATCRSVDETEHEVLLQDGAGVACASSLVGPALRAAAD